MYEGLGGDYRIEKKKCHTTEKFANKLTKKGPTTQQKRIICIKYERLRKWQIKNESLQKWRTRSRYVFVFKSHPVPFPYSIGITTKHPLNTFDNNIVYQSSKLEIQNKLNIHKFSYIIKIISSCHSVNPIPFQLIFLQSFRIPYGNTYNLVTFMLFTFINISYHTFRQFLALLNNKRCSVFNILIKFRHL